MAKTKKLDTNSKPAKYFKARQKGLNKKDAALEAGYSLQTALGNTPKIEATQVYKAMEVKYKDVLLSKIGIDEIADAHAENIRQEADRGARNKAIEMAYTKIEEDKGSSDKEERILVILR